MRDRLKNILSYIFRSWEDEGGYRNRRQEILPPFFYDILGFLILAAILINIGLYIWRRFIN